MRQPHSLLSLVATGVGTLAICSVFLGYGASYFDSQFQPLNAIGFTTSGVLMAFWSFVFGIPVVALYGVPLYSLLAARERATWANVLAAAALPSVVAALFAWQWGILIACFAFPVTVVMRATHGAGPNNSFKPKPLRGSA